MNITHDSSFTALLDSAGRFRRISLLCNVMSSSTLGRLNGFELDAWYRDRVALIGMLLMLAHRTGAREVVTMGDALVLADSLRKGTAWSSAFVRLRRTTASGTDVEVVVWDDPL